MMKEFSPEERLLNLIKRKEKQLPRVAEVDPSLQQQSSVSQGLEEDAGGAVVVPKKDIDDSQKKVLKDIRGDTEKDTPIPKGAPAKDKKQAQELDDKATVIKQRAILSFKSISQNKTLLFAAIIICLFLFGFFIFSSSQTDSDKDMESLKILIDSISDSKETKQQNAEEKLDIKETESKKEEEPKATSFQDYEKLLSSKSIFTAPATSRGKTKEISGPTLQEMIKSLRLVGVIPGDVPQVIIEDKKNSQTLFLKEGDKIQDMTIKDISNGSVVLEHNEETTTLSL